MILCICSSTYPTKFKTAVIASHMIASHVFFYSYFTFRTKSHIFFFNPINKLLIHSIITVTELPMKSIAAFETNILSTFAVYWFNICIFCSHVKFTAWLRTPFYERIWLKLLLLKEFLIFLVLSFIIWEHFFNVIIIE